MFILKEHLFSELSSILYNTHTHLGAYLFSGISLSANGPLNSAQIWRLTVIQPNKMVGF